MTTPVTDITDFKSYVESLVARDDVHLVDREVDLNLGSDQDNPG